MDKRTHRDKKPRVACQSRILENICENICLILFSFFDFLSPELQGRHFILAGELAAFGNFERNRRIKDFRSAGYLVEVVDRTQIYRKFCKIEN